MICFVAVFEQGDSGELSQLGEPRQFNTEESARVVADDLASKHSGVIAWRQNGDGPPIVFYTAGEVIQLE